MSDKQARARKAVHELEITAEAVEKLKAYWMQEAVKLASEGKQAEASLMLIKINVLETIRSMVRVPIDDWIIEEETAKARQVQPN